MQIMIFGFKLIHQFHHLHQKEYNHVLCPNLANPLDNAEIAKKLIHRNAEVMLIRKKRTYQSQEVMCSIRFYYPN